MSPKNRRAPKQKKLVLKREIRNLGHQDTQREEKQEIKKQSQQPKLI